MQFASNPKCLAMCIYVCVFNFTSAGGHLQVHVSDAGDLGVCSPDHRLLHPQSGEHFTWCESSLPVFCFVFVCFSLVLPPIPTSAVSPGE